MNILFVTPSYKPAFVYGGPTVSVSELAEALVAIGHSVTVYTTTANGTEELDVALNKPILLNGVSVYYFRRITGDHTHVSPDLWLKLWGTKKRFEIIHLQSWWSLLIVGAALVCSLGKQPYIISPRGMLGAYSFRNQHSFFKKLLHLVIGKRLLKKSILHATTELEWNDCTRVNNKWTGFIEHNLVQLPDINRLQKQQTGNSVFTIGFLSRIDPKKGIELLLQALALVPFQFKLKMAGTGDEAYIVSLKNLVNELNLAQHVEWCGWKGGEEKFHFLQSLDLFALTSYNENFAIAVTEALAVGTPVLVSNMVGLAPFVQERKLGFICRTTVQSIRKELINIYQNKEILGTIRNAAPATVTEDFNKEKLAEKYIEAYKRHTSTSIGN